MNFCFLCLVLLYVQSCSSDKVTHVTRGVPPAEQQKYIQSLSSGKFSCDNGEVSIFVEQVNDNFCDCSDGTDEPGTAACGSGAGFWCPNVGFRPQVVPSSFVGDGICDCCDGSDEALVPHSQCKDTCAEKASEHAKEEAARKERIERARSTRELAIRKGKEAEQVRKQQLEDLPTKLSDLAQRLEQAEGLLNQEEEAERQEKEARQKEVEATFRQSLRLHALSVVALKEVIIDLSLKKHEESGEALIDNVRAIVSDHDIDDTAVLAAALHPSQDDTPATKALKEAESQLADSEKEAVTNTEDSAKLGLAMEVVEAKRKAVHQAREMVSQELVVLQQEQRESLRLATKLDALTSQQLQDVAYGLAASTKQFKELAQLVKDNGGGDATAAVPGDAPDHRRPQTEDARRAVADLRAEKGDVERSRNTLEEEDRLDFGPNAEYFVLKGQCFSKQSGEHTYKMCPFGDATQGGRSIGKWAGWHKQTEWHSQYRMMQFKNGDRFGCPEDRELTVNLDCGDSAEITKVEEPSMCKYSMNFVCPEACTDDQAA
eukprot:EG_transcript_7667